MATTPRMRRLYHHLTHWWGEASDVIVFDETTARVSLHLPAVHIAVWRATEDDVEDVTIFNTIGMSEKQMREADYLVELNWGIRGTLTDDERMSVSSFLANLSEYPFDNDLKLDWWERLTDPGKIPVFTGCTQILLAPSPSFDTQELSSFPEPDNDVKILYVIPITPFENHLLAEHSVDDFLDYAEEEDIDLFSNRFDKRELQC